MSGTHLDRLLPRFDFSERHAIRVRATPERVYAACRTTELSRHPVVKVLLALRGMRAGEGAFPPPGFHLLADDPPHEMVLGIEGPFWQPRCVLLDVTAETFTRPVSPNAARGGWNFRVEERGAFVELTTETRVLCADDARLKFRLYWMLIRPFSGLIRRLMLRAIRDEAERAE